MRKVNNKYIFILGLILGLVISVTTVYAVDAYIESSKVTYNNHNKSNVEEAIDELYEKSGIHKEKWVDPILNGADPVFDKEGKLIPVEIKPNGDVYYANLNSEWYNYKEKRWANAVILIDNPSNINYGVGDKIEEDDIESYFVWIPRYKYKVWNTGIYQDIIEFKQLQNSKEKADTSLYNIISNARIIDIVFGDTAHVKVEGDTKQGSGISGGDTNVEIGNYLIHPAFKLGSQDLKGFWMGKFETGYKDATTKDEGAVDAEDSSEVVIKPNVYSWRYNSVKNMFMTAYNYERKLESHMLKNTEWGAVAYLSHSIYGIGTEVKINNSSNYITGSVIALNLDIDTPGNADESKTQSYNSDSGYFASTTGNITGVYDMSGGSSEVVAACLEINPSEDSTIEQLKKYMESGYIDKYNVNSSMTTFNYRILGDATGEMGPFYKYYTAYNESQRSGWYSDFSYFATSTLPWFHRGGLPHQGTLAGQFYFGAKNSNAGNYNGFRVSLAIQ